MSSLIVETCKIREIKIHKNADSLEIVLVKGWECIVKKEVYNIGDIVIYIPVDSILPIELADRLNVRNYLKGKNRDRVGCAKLRREMSYGLIIDNENNYEEGHDCTEELGICKYEPPIRTVAGDAAHADPLFDKFTDIENIRNFPDVFKEGEMVVITEKIDGTSSRNGCSIKNGLIEWKAGSHRVKRKKPVEEEIKNNTYWFPFTIKGVKELLSHVVENKMVKVSVTLYGEVYGRVRGGHKSMHYGKQNSLNYVAFALKIDGCYVDRKVFSELCERFDVPQVPLVDMIPFNMEKIKELASGKSILADMNGVDHIREGIVVCPITEREDYDCGRVI